MINSTSIDDRRLRVRRPVPAAPNHKWSGHSALDIYIPLPQPRSRLGLDPALITKELLGQDPAYVATEPASEAPHAHHSNAENAKRNPRLHPETSQCQKTNMSKSPGHFVSGSRSDRKPHHQETMQTGELDRRLATLVATR